MSKAVIIERRPITKGLVDMLAVAMARPVGDPDFPEGTVLDLETGYHVVHSIDGGDMAAGPPMHNANSEADLIYQVDSAGGTRGHVEWLADRVRLSMLSRHPDGTYQVAFPHPPGWRVIRRAAESDIAPGVVTGGTPEHRIFTVNERFRLYVASDL